MTTRRGTEEGLFVNAKDILIYMIRNGNCDPIRCRSVASSKQYISCPLHYYDTYIGHCKGGGNEESDLMVESAKEMFIEEYGEEDLFEELL